MKISVRSWLTLAALVSPLALATPARATVVWTSTFEKNKSGDICSSAAADSEWKPGINETKGARKNAEVLGEQVHSGALACKITVHPDDTFTFGQDRVDIQHPLVMPTSDIYISGYYMMPDDAKVRNEIGFFETEKPSYTNFIDFWVEPKTGGGTTLTLGVEQLGAVKVWSGDFAKGKWHQVAIHVAQSTAANGGTLDFWLDGQQVVTGYKHKTKPNNDNFFFQAGLHRKDTSNNTDVLYMDDFLQGTTAVDLQLGESSDGGTTPDGATAGSGGGAAGAGGTTGNAGTTGTGGSIGAAGDAGNAGATGAAGSNGVGGSMIGSAGTTGIGGVSGTSGSSGNAGSTAGAGSGATTGSGCSCAFDARSSDGPGMTFSILGIVAVAIRRKRRAQSRFADGRTRLASKPDLVRQRRGRQIHVVHE